LQAWISGIEMKLPVNDDFLVRMSSSRDGSSQIMSTISGLAEDDDGVPAGDDLRRSPPASGDVVALLLQ
jgi:hypothetical protein